MIYLFISIVVICFVILSIVLKKGEMEYPLNQKCKECNRVDCFDCPVLYEDRTDDLF